MGTTYRFIADPAEPAEVLAWFRSLSAPPREVATDQRVTLHFSECGSPSYGPSGDIDPKASPIATVFLPQVRRGQLWTVGEVHFLATPLRQQFPVLHKISSSFSRWLSGLECVYSNKRPHNEYGYYLQGSVQGYDAPVYAFESGLRALKAGRYFVGDDDNDAVLETLCKALRLRGVDCAAA